MTNRPQKLKRPWIPEIKSGIANRVRDPFYHTNAWRVASKWFIGENPLCTDCQKAGRLEPSKITDHIIAKDKCIDPWDPNNWQALCRNCHSKKSGRDKKQFK